MKKSGKKTLILIDAHAILHRAFHALPNFTSPKGEPTGALYGFSSMVLKILKEFEPDYVAACYDLPKPTFRHLFYEKYKAQRPKMAEELGSQIEASKKMLQTFGIPVFESEGFEADDILATIAQKVDDSDSETIIVTGDLDTLQLVSPGVKVYAMKKGIQEAVLYDEKAVKERYGFPSKFLPDYKGLVGDPSDNIVGVKGIGEKTAGLLIKNFKTLEKLYEILKKDKKKIEEIGIKPRVIKLLEENEEEAYFSKTLVETRRDVPVSFSTKKADWKSGFNRAEAESFLRDFGFRSLISRFPVLDKETGFPTGNPVSAIPQKLEKELKVMFWLLNSRRTNPSAEDIVDFTKTDSLVEAEKSLRKQIEKDGLSKLYYDVEAPLISILERMEERGILLDTEYLKNLSLDYHQRLSKIEKIIWEMAGEEFNINSPKQLAEILFKKMGLSSAGLKRTGKGNLSTNFSALEKLTDRHPVIQEIFSYRELAKLVSTYVDTLPSLTDKSSRLHTSFHQTGTATGRLSSSEPNLQNIPIRSEFGRAVRKAFVAPKGCVLVSFDYSQIELRVAASLSGDKKLKEAFLKSDDIHNRVAAEVFNVEIKNVDSEMRRRAKVINFGILYGMGINSLKKNLNCSREEAEKFYREYFTDFSGMAEYMEKIKREARMKGFTTTIFGRRRYLPEINSPIEYIRKEAERMAINAPVQGSAADIIKKAAVEVEKFLKAKKIEEKCRMLLQVHDELIFEIDSDIINHIAAPLKKIMESSASLGVPLVADVSTGENWAEMTKINFSKIL